MTRRSWSVKKIAVRGSVWICAAALLGVLRFPPDRWLIPASKAQRAPAGRSSALPTLCPPALEDVRINLTTDHQFLELLRWEQRTATDVIHTTPSFRVIQRVDTPEGPLFQVELRDGRTWYSYHGRDTKNPQGDPRVLATVFGPRAARTFGLRLSRVWKRSDLPGAERLNWGVDQLAQNGVPVSLRFYETAGHSSFRDFIRRMARDRALPIGIDPAYLGHDLGFHSAAIALPEAVAQHVQIQARAVEALLHELDNLPRLSEADRMRRDQVVQFIEERYVQMLDTGTGNFAEGLRASLAGDLDGHNSMYSNGFEFLTQHGEAPGTLIRKLLEEALGQVRHKPAFATHCKRALHSVTTSDAFTFIEMTSPLQLSWRQFVNRTVRRAERIREVAEALAPPHHPDSF